MNDFADGMFGEIKKIYHDKVADLLNSHIVLNLATFFMIIFFGFIISYFIERAVKRIIRNSRWDGVITGFIVKLIKTAILVITFITALPYIGIKTTTLLAVVGAAGLAIGLSLQSSLSNLSSGILLLIFQPFQYGDHIKTEDIEGVVEDLNIMNTTLKSTDGSIVVIPNSSIINNAIINYTKNPYKKSEILLFVDNAKDEKVLMFEIKNMIMNHELTLNDLGVSAGIRNLEKDGVNINFSWWTLDNDNEINFFDIMLKLKKIVDKK
jgi:small conductance mechanosensitive channel